MKNQLRVLFALMFCLVVCQSNVNGQGFKKAIIKAKEAASNVPKKTEVTEKGVNNSKSAEAPSAGPSKPLAPDNKNSVSEIKAYTGLTKEAFEAKIKSLGFVSTEIDFVGMGAASYKSSSKGYLLSVDYGTRGNVTVVRSVYKGIVTKTPNLNTIKSSFLGYGTQCTDLKATFTSAYAKPITATGKKRVLRTPEERTAEFLPALNEMISGNQEGGANDQYSDKDFQYEITYQYTTVMGAIIIIKVTDITVDSLEG